MRSVIFVQLLILIAAIALALDGCSGAKDATKETSLVWPSPPDEPRIKFIRTMQGEDDYHSGLGALTEALAGKSVNTVLSNPFDVCTDGHGKVWVTDVARGIFLFDDDKQEVKGWGGESRISLNDPRGITYGDGKVFVGVLSQGQIVVLTPEGNDLYAIGRRGQFPSPVDVVFDSVKRRLIVVDNKLHSVSVLTERGDSLFSFGKRGSADGLFNFPQSAAVDSAGNIYVLDSFNFRVEIFDSTGKYLRKFGEQGDAWGMFGRPKGLALDTYGNIYVTDGFFHNLQIFNQQGELLLFVGKFSADNDGFQDPVSLYIDRKNDIYVTDQLNKRVQVFQLLKGN